MRRYVIRHSSPTFTTISPRLFRVAENRADIPSGWEIAAVIGQGTYYINYYEFMDVALKKRRLMGTEHMGPVSPLEMQEPRDDFATMQDQAVCRILAMDDDRIVVLEGPGITDSDFDPDASELQYLRDQRRSRGAT